MRPTLSDGLLPPAPTKDIAASTPGCWLMISATRPCRSAIASKRDVLRRFGEAEQLAGVLTRHEALGHPWQTEIPLRTTMAEKNNHGGALMRERPAQGQGKAFLTGVEAAFRSA